MILPSCGNAQLEVVANLEESFNGIEEIVVNGGSLEVTYDGSAQEDVFLSAYLESNQSNGETIVYRVEGKRLIVDYKKQIQVGMGNLTSKGFISLTGPEHIKLEISNGSGRMFVSNVTSDRIDLKVSSGKIEARNLSTAKAFLTASSGSFDVEGVQGSLECKASSGGGRLSNIEGNVSVVATSGSYTVSEVEGVVNGSVSSGSITLNHIGELGSLEISSGRVKADHAGMGENTRFSGSSGSFTIQTDGDLEEYNFELSASSGSLEVGNTKTRRKLNMDYGSSVTVSGAISSGKISIQN